MIVISESTAKTLWPGEDPIGHRVRIGDAATGPWRTIVGIAGDVRHASLDAAPTLQMYTPQAQVTDSYLVLTVRSGFADVSRHHGPRPDRFARPCATWIPPSDLLPSRRWTSWRESPWPSAGS